MENPLSLFALNVQVKERLNASFSSHFNVVAEISEFQENRGHAYLELIEKDVQDKVIAKAKATIWANTYRLLKAYFESTTGYSIETGLKVLLTVTVEFHEIYGYSLNVRDIDPTYTLGNIARKRAAIIRMLEEEGVIHMNKEIEFPAIPQRIAIISSKTAAGYEDFMDHLIHNEYGFKFYTKLYESLMQGDETEKSIVNALERINLNRELFDVVVIIRGGGSKSDLSAFDSYPIALNISQYPLPVITGIGHDRDETVADLVACVSLKTPTAVADYLIGRFLDAENYLESLKERIYESAELLLDANRQIFDRLNVDFKIKAQEQLRYAKNRLDKNIGILKILTKSSLKAGGASLDRYTESVVQRAKRYLADKNRDRNAAELKLKPILKTYISLKKQQLELLKQRSEFADPNTIISRGYSITYLNGKVVKSVHQIKADDLVETKIIDGTFRAIVTN